MIDVSVQGEKEIERVRERRRKRRNKMELIQRNSMSFRDRKKMWSLWGNDV